METQTLEQEPKQPEPEATLTLPDSRQFKALLTLLKDVVDNEIVFEINENGVSMIQMEPSRCAMTDLSIPKHATEEFYCKVPGKFMLDVDKTVKRVLKKVNKDEQVQIDLGKYKAQITLKARLKRVFKLPLLELPEDTDVPKPKVVFTNQVKLITSAGKEIMEDVEEGGHVRITADSESIKFADDNEDVPFEVTLTKGSDCLLDIESKSADPVATVYSANYLKGFFKALAPLTEIFNLEFAKDFPLRITAYIMGGCELHYYLAPRIEGD